MKKIIFVILLFVFCLQAKEVIDEMVGNYILYDENGNEVNRIEEFVKQKYEYDDDGSLKQSISTNLENPEFPSIMKYNDYGEIKEIEMRDLMNQDLVSKITYDYERNSDGNIIKIITVTEFYGYGNDDYQYYEKSITNYIYNNDNTYIEEISYYNENNEFRYMQKIEVTLNSKQLAISMITYDEKNNPLSKTEIEYNSNNFPQKTTTYVWNNSYVKQSEMTYDYTYKTINTTAINPKQTTKTKNNFQISRNSNSFNLNFADNSQKRIEIVNLQGKMLKQTSFSAKNASVDISTLSKGIFFLRVFENGKVNSVKFVRE